MAMLQAETNQGFFAEGARSSAPNGICSAKQNGLFFIFFTGVFKQGLFLMLFTIGVSLAAQGQVTALSSVAKHDTLVELTETGFCKRGYGVYKYKFYKGRLYVLVYREEKNRLLYLHVYSANTFNYESGYLINHASAGDAPVDFDINEPYLVIACSRSRLMYKQEGIEFFLLWKEMVAAKEVRNSYQHAGLLNDSVVAFVRTNPYLGLSADETLEVLLCSVYTGTYINRISLPADVPELGFLKNNHRVAFANGNIIVGNFNQVELFIIRPPYVGFDVVKQWLIPSSPPLQKKFEAAKSAAIKQQSMAPIERLFTNEFLNSVTVFCNVHAWADSSIMTRVICPRKENNTLPNNRIDFWRIHGANMEHIAAFSDNDNTLRGWLGLGHNTTNTPYLIYENRIYFFSCKPIEEGKAARDVQTVSVYLLNVPH